MVFLIFFQSISYGVMRKQVQRGCVVTTQNKDIQSSLKVRETFLVERMVAVGLTEKNEESFRIKGK